MSLGARRATGVVATLACLLLAILPVVRRTWLCDDIFITFRYVENALAGHGLVYNPGERVEGYTHFLWTLLLWVGARLGLELETLGRWLPLAFDAALVLLLARSGARLFGSAARAGVWGVPVAALLWALHADARSFASGGLETAAYTAFLVAGFHLTAVAGATSARATTAGAAAYALAALTRPEGILHLGLAAAYVAWRERRGTRATSRGRAPERDASPKALARFALVAAALFVPFLVWRLAYYHDIVPNPAHAKSAARPYFSQGLDYVGVYFQYYAALALGAIAAVWVIWRRRKPAGVAAAGGSEGSAAAAALGLAGAHVLATIGVTTWVGGDFMFARFLLPATPFLCLLCESAALAAGRAAPAVAVALAAGVAAGGAWRLHALGHHNVEVHGIADERAQYPPDLLATRQRQGDLLRRCFAGTRATFLIQGAQASYAYYGRLPIAIEAYGLTDRTIARLPLERRGRPGHERRVPFEYLVARRTQFLIHLPGARPRHEFARIDFGDLTGEILIWDRDLMAHVRDCDSIRCTDFPAYFDAWLERAPEQDATARQRDADVFRIYYFDANPDPERLARLEAVLRTP